MRTSHCKIKQEITAQKSKLTDEEIFTSNQFSAYLTDIAETVTKRYGRGMKVNTFSDTSKEAKLAYTNNQFIFINVTNYIIQNLPNKTLKTDSILGFLGHEIGHILYTDFIMLFLYRDKLKKGTFYPKEPSNLTEKQAEYLKEIKQYFQDKEAMETIRKIAQYLVNILEDIYVEERMCNQYNGSFETGILLNNILITEKISSIKEQLKQQNEEILILLNLILSYARTGEINNLGNYKGPLLDTFFECIPIIDHAIYEEDAKVRFQATNQMLVLLFPYIDHLIKKIKEEKKDGINKTQEKLKEQTKKQSPLPTSISSQPVSNETSIKKTEKNKKQKQYEEIKKNLHSSEHNTSSTTPEKSIEEGKGEGRIPLKKTEEIEETGTGSITYNRNYEGSGYVSRAAADIKKIITSVAEQKIYRNYEKKLSEELQQEANKIRYGNAHRNIHININRIPNISPNYIEEYQKIAPPLLFISKRLQKQVEEMLKDYMTGGKLNNLPFGKRVNARNAIHKDGKIFYKTILPQETIGIAVAILNDESGSMSSYNRITYARATSIILHDFCKQLQIPICIYGHSTKSDTVELYSYAEYDSIDNQDKYRIMDMSARSQNRDGAALRFVAEQLLKRPEKLKLFFLISDGQPYATGYTGTEAEADLRGIKKEYKNKGIHLFAAAIGDDKANIKRIYGDSFLDISNLSKLPQNLGRLLIHYIKQQIN